MQFIISNTIAISEMTTSNNSFSMSINSPINKVYNKKQIFLDIIIDKPIENINFISSNDLTLSEKTLCKNCNRFYGSKTFHEGEQFLTIIGRNRLETIEKNVTFFIDSIKPRLSIIYPRNNNYVNGKNFQLKIIEKMPNSLSIYYGNDINGIKSEIINISNNCKIDKKENEYICDFDVDLGFYEKEKIYFYYYISDIANNTYISRPVWINVDTTCPIIENQDSFARLEGDYLNFNIAVIEDNLKSIQFIDYKEDNPKLKSLCTTLREGFCEKRVYTKLNEFNITLFITDKAGNILEKSLYFLG